MLNVLSSPLVLLTLFIVSLIIGAIWKLKSKRTDEENPPQSIQLNSVAVLAVVALAVLFQLPSLSIDINGIFTYAFDVVNAFMPLIAIIAGLGLGFNLITKISSLFTRAL